MNKPYVVEDVIFDSAVIQLQFPSLVPIPGARGSEDPEKGPDGMMPTGPVIFRDSHSASSSHHHHNDEILRRINASSAASHQRRAPSPLGAKHAAHPALRDAPVLDLHPHGRIGGREIRQSEFSKQSEAADRFQKENKTKQTIEQLNRTLLEPEGVGSNGSNKPKGPRKVPTDKRDLKRQMR